MIFELLLFTFLGILLGIFTGLIPGLHVNTIALLILSAGFAGVVEPYPLAIIIIAMAITHTIYDFVPSILLGMPESSTALSVLPGHRLLMEGRGLEAIYLTVMGGVVAILLSLVSLPLLIVIIPFFYQNVHSYIHILLIFIAAIIILSHSGVKRRLLALTCFMLSGALGLLVLNSYILPSYSLFFPLFTGLFGLSTLIFSYNEGNDIPKQTLEFPKIRKRMALIGSVKAMFSGMLVGTLPGVGASQATILTQQITRKKDSQEFLISIGGINTIVALFSLISLFTIFRARSGAAIAVQQILVGFGFNELLLLIAVAFLAVGISSLLLMKSLRPMVSIIERINYSLLTFCVIVFLVIMTVILTGWIGLLILFTSTSIGLLAPLLGVKRSNLMGVLILHLILFYAGI
jgi:putative membrane protein